MPLSFERKYMSLTSNDSVMKTAQETLFGLAQSIGQPSLRDLYIKFLNQDICMVWFKKVSGEERRMRCTLVGNLIPAEDFPDGSRSYKSTDVVRCYDLDKKGFRSFRVDSVISFETPYYKFVKEENANS